MGSASINQKMVYMYTTKVFFHIFSLESSDWTKALWLNMTRQSNESQISEVSRTSLCGYGDSHDKSTL